MPAFREKPYKKTRKHMRPFSYKHIHHKKHRSHRNKPGSYNHFERSVTVTFLEMLLMIKLFHWKTHSYATHKATDDLYSKLNTNIDSFIEILLGKTNTRINLMNTKTIKLKDVNSLEQFKKEIVQFKHFLVALNHHPTMKSMSNTDLYNIRDTILGDMNQLLYLLTFT